MLLFILIFCAFTVLVLPVAIKLRLYLDFHDKRAFYSIFLFGFIRVNSGYMSVNKNFLILHFSDKKAYAVKITSLMPNKNNADMLKHFNLVSIKSSAIIGDEDELKIFFAASVLNAVNAITFSVLKVIKNNVEYKCDIYMTDKDTKAYFTDVIATFKLFSIIQIIVKKIYGSIKNVKGN